MKKIITTLSIIATLASCKQEAPVPIPPKPYTNAQVVSEYWKEAVKYNLGDPYSFVLISEEIDSAQSMYNDDTVTYIIIKADFTYKNEFGGTSRKHENFVGVRDKFLAVGVSRFRYIRIFGESAADEFLEVNEYEPLKRVATKDAIRTLNWNAYNDSINRTK